MNRNFFEWILDEREFWHFKHTTHTHDSVNEMKLVGATHEIDFDDGASTNQFMNFDFKSFVVEQFSNGLISKLPISM